MITIRYLESQRIVYKYLHPNNIIIQDKEPILKNYEIINKKFNDELLTSANENTIQIDIYFLIYLIDYLLNDYGEKIYYFKEKYLIPKLFRQSNEKIDINELIKIFCEENLSKICDIKPYEDNIFHTIKAATEDKYAVVDIFFCII